MRCPNDSSELIVTERHGIDIRTCPTCRGVWLERGDLDEIINRSIPGGITAASVAAPPEGRRGFLDRLEDAVEDRFDGDRRRRRDKYSEDDYLDHARKPKKKKGKRDMIEDLIDF